MHVHTFFSVHEKLFDAVNHELRDRFGVTRFSGFIWGEDQRRFLAKGTVPYSRLNMFSRDVAPLAGNAPDIEYLERCEARYDVSLHRMIFSERNFLDGHTYDEMLRYAEVLFRLVERTFEEDRPDFVYSENVGGLTSYIHWAVARGMNIPYWAMGASKLENRMAVSKNGLNHWNLTYAKFAELRVRGLRDDERRTATAFVEGFRERPTRLTHTVTRARLPVIEKRDLELLYTFGSRYVTDRGNPTLKNPVFSLSSRAKRLARSRAALAKGVFERPVEGERYVLFPIHFQPEATTLVQAPYYLDQAALIEDIAKSLPVGTQLYVKEHFTNRGRRSLAFYDRIRSTFGVRLLGPDEDSWALIDNAAAIAVITGSMGWEGLLKKKPVISFGDIYYNQCPLVYRAGEAPKDQWHALFRKALFEHEHDEELLLAFYSAIEQTTFPGFVKNATTFPKALEPANVRNVANAVAHITGLDEAPAATRAAVSSSR